MPNVDLSVAIKMLGEQILARTNQNLKDIGKSGQQAGRGFDILNAAAKGAAVSSDAELDAAERWYNQRMVNEKLEKKSTQTKQQERNAFMELAEGIRTATADFRAGIITSEQYQLALRDSRNVAIELRAELGALSGKSLSGFNQVISATTPKVQNFANNGFMLRSALGLLAAEAVGATGVMGRFATGLLLFTSGGAWSLGLITFLAAAALGYHVLSREAKEARKEVEDTADSLFKQHESQRSPLAARPDNIRQAQEALVFAQERLKSVADHEASARSGSFFGDLLQTWDILWNKGKESSDKFREAILALHQAQAGAFDKANDEAKARLEVLRNQVVAQKALVALNVDDATIQDRLQHLADRTMLIHSGMTKDEAAKVLSILDRNRALERQLEITSQLRKAQQDAKAAELQGKFLREGMTTTGLPIGFQFNEKLQDQLTRARLAVQGGMTSKQIDDQAAAEARLRTAEREISFEKQLSDAREASTRAANELHETLLDSIAQQARVPADIQKEINIRKEQQEALDEVALSAELLKLQQQGLTVAQAEELIAAQRVTMEHNRQAQAVRSVTDAEGDRVRKMRQAQRETGLRLGAQGILQNAAGGAFDALGQFGGRLLSGQSLDTKKALAENAAAVRDLNAAFAAGKMDLTEYQSKLSELGDERKLALARANPLRQFAATMTATLGAMLSELGKALIAFGLGGVAIRKFVTNPAVAIAAGVTLVALGAALSAKAASIADAGGASLAGGGSSISSGGFSDAQADAGKGDMVIYLEGEYVLDPTNTIRVDQFVSMLESASGRRVILRPTGATS